MKQRTKQDDFLLFSLGFSISLELLPFCIIAQCNNYQISSYKSQTHPIWWDERIVKAHAC